MSQSQNERKSDNDLIDWIRSNWRVGSYCEVYSNSSQSWWKGRITNILKDSEGEWLEIQYTVGNTKRCREVQRYDANTARPFTNALKIYEYIYKASTTPPSTKPPSVFGQQQSPINIVTSHSKNKHKIISDAEFQRNPLYFKYPLRVTNCAIVNNGHSVQVNIDSINKCSVMIHNKVYELMQFHFHAPSEHTIDSIKYEMEMHLVHVNKQKEIAVLAFMFRSGSQLEYSDTFQQKHEVTDVANTFLDQIWDELPLEKTKQEIVLKKTISFDHLFKEASNNVIKSIGNNEMEINMEIFEYIGSLTTPPYTEGVQWLVSKKAHFMSKEQLNKLRSCWNYKNNARAIQDYFGRTVSLRSKSSLLLSL